MKPLIVICVLLGYFTGTFAQTGKVVGSVMDAQTNTPLELATISFLNRDSSLIGYQLSDKFGKFAFSKLPLKKELLVTVTYTGYTAYTRNIQLATDKPDTLLITLDLGSKDTVVVRAVSPVRMNGDTLEINPAAFKMKDDAVVEELLNQVSGITIWSDGTITVNGKKVETLLVDGKPFLGSTDSRVATQNLPKASIDKIQLYQEYDRSKIGQPGARQQDSLLTMNIKLKESSKKGYFGKAGGGYGTTNRFEGDLSLQIYNKTTSAGIGAGINNVNKTVGNIQEMFQNNTYRNYNPNLYNVGRFGTSGVNKNHSIGGVFTHSFIDVANSRQNNRIAINYNKSGTDAYLTDLSLQNRTAIDNPQFIREEGVQNTLSNRQDLGVNYVKTNSYNDNFNLNGSVNTNKEEGNSTRFTDVRDSANQLQSTNKSYTSFNRRSDNKSFTGNYSRSDGDNPIKNITVNFNAGDGNNLSERFVRSYFESVIDPAKNTNFNRVYNTDDHNTRLGANIDYGGLKRLLFGRYNLFGVNLNLNQIIGYNRSANNSSVSDYDSTTKQYVINNKISNRNERDLFQYSPALSLSKSSFKFFSSHYRYMNFLVKLAEDIKTEKNRSASFAARNLDRSFQFFRQEANASYQFTKQNKFQYVIFANYSKNYDFPSVDQLYTIVDDINVYDIRYGNPLLKNRINHSFNLNSNFNTQNEKSPYSINGNASGGYTRSLNPITDSLINDPSGKRIFYYTNADKSDNLDFNYNFNISRRFQKNTLQLMYNGQFRTGTVPNYIDNLYNISKTNNLSNQFTLQLTVGSLLVVTAAKTFQTSESRQTAAGLNAFRNANNITKLGLVVNYPKN
ncbi:MAG: carboxypeptidase regulatory-like domain-containing protein, partial [Chitinophagaceae bacterium]